MRYFDRELMSHLIIVLALCVGGWLMFVEPIMRSAADEAGFIVDVRRSGLAGLDEGSLRRMTDYIDRVRHVVGEVRDRSAFAGDTTSIYSTIMETAEAQDVDVERITPVSRAGMRSTVAATSFDIVVRGDYARVADFLGALDQMQGFVRMRRVVLGTIDVEGGLAVDATVTCDAVALGLPAELATMVGGIPRS